MDNNPIKYSDIIAPDDSIKTLIAQLEELQKVFENLMKTVTTQASEMAAGMKNMSGATEEGRRAISQTADEAQKIANLKARIIEAGDANAYELERLKQELKDVQTEVKNTVREQRALEKAQGSGSYNELAARYNLIKQQLNAMSEAERNAARGAGGLVEQAAKLYAKMKELQAETGKMTLNVGNYGDATANLKKELKDLLAEMAQMERAGQRGSDRYKDLARQAGALQDNLSDARAEMKRYASDTLLLDDAVDIVTTATTAWQVYQGAVNAFGIESEEAAKAMAKLQGIVEMTNGLQQLAAKFTDNSTATYKIYHRILRLVGLEKKAETVATTANTAAKGANTTATTANTAATAAETVAMEASATGMTAATVAAKALRTALMTIGIGLLVAAIGALVAYWDDIVKFFEDWGKGADEATISTKDLNEVTADASKEYAKATAEMSVYQQRIVSFNGTKQEEAALVAELNQKYGSSLGTYQTLAEWKTELDKRGRGLCEALLLEAEAQAILNKYIEAYQQLQTIKSKPTSDFVHLYNPFTWWNGGAEKRLAEQGAQETADAWLKAYRDKMDEANAMRSQFNLRPSISTRTTGGGGGRTGRGGTTTDPKKQAEEEAKRQEEQYKEALRLKRAYEDEQLKLEADEWEKRKQQTRYQYDRQIEDLKHQLLVEKDLTEENRAYILGTIEALGKQRADALAVIEDEAEQKLKEELEKQSEIYKQYIEKRNETQYQARTREIQTEIETIEELLMAIRTGTAMATEEEIKGLEERVETLTKEAKDITREAVRDIVSDALDVLNAADIDWSDPMRATQAMTEALLDLKDAFSGGDFKDKVTAVAETFNILTSAIESAMEAQQQQAQAAVEAANKQVEAAKTSLAAELEARNQGYANNVELAQKELDMARKNQEKARKEQERAQKAQAAVQTVQQIGNLVTASSLIWSQLGFPLAIPAIAVMWGSFAAAKIKAAQMTKTEEYGEGTVELLQGGSHQSGNDIDLGRKKDGTRRRAEGGEYFAVINRRSSRRFRRLIPNVVKSLNDGTFLSKYGNAYPDAGIMVMNAQNDISQLSEDVRAIRANTAKKVITMADGSTIEINGQTTRRIRHEN